MRLASSGSRTRGSPLAAACLIASAAGATGCATLTRINIREAREYANEDPNAAVIVDRLHDSEAVLALADALLSATPYSPGDPWIRELPMNDAEGAAIRERLAAAPPYSEGEHEVPVAKLYRAHTEQVLRRARWTRKAKPASFPSVLDALDHLTKDASPLRGAWSALQAALSARFAAAKERGKARVPSADHDVERALIEIQRGADALRAADIRAPAASAVAKDALVVLSIALRANVETEGVLSAVASQAARANRVAARDISVLLGQDPAVPLPGVSSYAEIVLSRAESESAAIQSITEALIDLTRTPIYKTAGWQLHENIILQGIGIDLDSIRMRFRGDGQILFFNQFGAPDATLEQYHGYTRRLAYEAEPIAFIGSRLIVTFDWLHVKNAARINAGFATDRVWSSGGAMDESASMGPQIGMPAFKGDLFDIGLDLIGLRTKVKVARFTSGQVREIAVDPRTGADLGTIKTAPLELSYKQVDAGFDVAYLDPDLAAKYWAEDLLVGFRYMGYRLPRILYELRDADPSPNVAEPSFSRESPSQSLQTDYYMGGVAARFGQGDFRAVSLFADLGIYGGAGPSSFYFLKDPNAADAPTNRDRRSDLILVLNASMGVGARLRLTPRKMRVRFLAEIQYHADILGQALVSELSETTTAGGTTYTLGRRVDLGGFDVFHGPHIQLVGIF